MILPTEIDQITISQMRGQRAESIGSVLTKYLQGYNLETQLLEKRVAELWPQVIGDKLVAYTGKPEVKQGILYVSVPSAPLRQEFFMARQEIVRRINEAVGAQVVKQLRLRG